MLHYIGVKYYGQSKLLMPHFIYSIVNYLHFSHCIILISIHTSAWLHGSCGHYLAASSLSSRGRPASHHLSILCCDARIGQQGSCLSSPLMLTNAIPHCMRSLSPLVGGSVITFQMTFPLIRRMRSGIFWPIRMTSHRQRRSRTTDGTYTINRTPSCLLHTS